MINRTWKERIKELERKVLIIELENQKLKCKEGIHVAGELVESQKEGRYWVRCPACWTNLSKET